MVQGVEKLSSKLRTLRFPDWKIFVQREIDIVRIRTDQRVTAGISKRIFCRILVCSGVEPVIYAALSPGQVGVWHNLVRPLCSRGSGIRLAGTRRGKHETARQRVDASEMPAADHRVNSPVGAAQEPPLPSKGKHIVIRKGPVESLV